MTNESEDEHGEFGGELLPACDSSVKEKKNIDQLNSLKPLWVNCASTK